ncbi:hypothetical protein R3P38DRAFT_2788403 [Favolaschia claudopus]|uniref:Uncharacterized protein n=1 Tax=Favolaschia claudopus TaxID=2862362 RepID=A0AAW0AKA1_9AGAR
MPVVWRCLGLQELKVVPSTIRVVHLPKLQYCEVVQILAKTHEVQLGQLSARCVRSAPQRRSTVNMKWKPIANRDAGSKIRGKSRKIEVSNPASRSDGWMILKSFNAPQDPSSMKEELNSVYPHPKFASRWMEWECEGGEARLATPSANAMPVVVWVGTAKEGAYERTEYLSSFAELPLALHCSDLARVKDNSKRDTTLAAPQRGCRGDAPNAIEGNNERRQSTLSGRIGSAEEGDGREVGRNGTSVGERRDRVSARARGCEISTASNASQADRKTYSISPTLPPTRRRSISGNGIRQGRRNAKGTARGGDEETRGTSHEFLSFQMAFADEGLQPEDMYQVF